MHTSSTNGHHALLAVFLPSFLPQARIPVFHSLAYYCNFLCLCWTDDHNAKSFIFMVLTFFSQHRLVWCQKPRLTKTFRFNSFLPSFNISCNSNCISYHTRLTSQHHKNSVYWMGVPPAWKVFGKLQPGLGYEIPFKVHCTYDRNTIEKIQSYRYIHL
jgi:hypothetical protein